MIGLSLSSQNDRCAVTSEEAEASDCKARHTGGRCQSGCQCVKENAVFTKMSTRPIFVGLLIGFHSQPAQVSFHNSPCHSVYAGVEALDAQQAHAHLCFASEDDYCLKSVFFFFG